MEDDRFGRAPLSIRAITEGAMCTALSVVLSFFAVLHMPQGGSVTLSMVPLIFFSQRHGARVGARIAAAAGFIHMILGGFIVHPIQALLDYPIAYAMMALSGLRLRSMWISTAIAFLGRLACHVASGVIFFSEYAPAGRGTLIYSLVYNVTFIVPEFAVSLASAYAVSAASSKIIRRV